MNEEDRETLVMNGVAVPLPDPAEVQKLVDDTPKGVGTNDVRQWLIDNPGFHFTEDVVDNVLLAAGLNPEHAVLRKKVQAILYYMERSGYIESGGSHVTRKWRIKS